MAAALAAQQGLALAQSPPLWTGFYAGATAGVQWTDLQAGAALPNINLFEASRNTSAIIAASTGDGRSARAAVSGLLGYAWQSDRFVYGVEAGIGLAEFATRRARTFIGIPHDNVRVVSRDDIDGNLLATLRVRAGVEAGRSLFFVTGGVAYSDAQARRTVDFPGPTTFVNLPVIGFANLACGPAGRCWSGSGDFGLGWTIGAGVDHRLTGPWSLRVEATYADFDRLSFSTPAADPAASGAALKSHFRLDSFSTRIGFLYQPGAPAPSPKAPPAFMWSGLYGGVTAGGHAGGRAKTMSTPDPLATPGAKAQAAGFAAMMSGGLSGNRFGFAGGAQLGWAQEGAGGHVYGVEADIQKLTGAVKAQATRTADIGAVAPVIFTAARTVESSIDWLATVRGRYGVLVRPDLLLYGTAGIAFGGARGTTYVLQSPAVIRGSDNVENALSRGSGTAFGWAAGFGLESPFGDRVSGKLEYLYYDLGSMSYRGAFDGYSNAQSCCALRFSNPLVTSLRLNGHVLRAGVNVRFN